MQNRETPGTRPPRATTNSWSSAIVTSPWLWGAAATFGFYQLLPHLPVWQEIAVRYFCSHPLEYALTGLFFVGLAIIAIKAIRLAHERSIFRRVNHFGEAREPGDNENILADEVASLGPNPESTYWGHRLCHIRTYFQSQQRPSRIDDHLTYLSDSAAHRLQESYSLLQTVVWAIPIIGFLGTVMGITMAIANVTPEQLESSMNDVTSGLAVAFDTTAVALSLSLVLGFASLFVKRGEEKLLNDIDERCRVEVHRCFPDETGPSSPLAAAEVEAAQALITQTDALIAKQTNLWSSSIEAFRERWEQTLDQQRVELQSQLQSGAAGTLDEHHQQLRAFRDEFVSAYKDVGERLQTEMAQLEASRQQFEERMSSRFAETLEDFESRLAAVTEQQQAQTAATLDQFASRIESWQQNLTEWQRHLETVAEKSESQIKLLSAQSDSLAQIIGTEEQLAGLQHRLTENLQALRATEAFDETLHNLSAAVHLLTTRARARDAA